MKKMLIVAVMVVAIFAAMSGVAFAHTTEGVNGAAQFVAADGGMVHGSYATTTNACKVCHDVHGNTSYKLFLAASASEGCAVCHVAVTAATTVYTGAYDAHVIDADSTLAALPDSSSTVGMLGSDALLGCMDCHDAAPHGMGAGTMIALSTEATSRTDFCLGCHDENDGRLTGGVRADDNTHVMAGLGVAYTEFGATTTTHADAGATSATCENCHTNGTADDFPHSGNYKLLIDGAAAQALDVSCMACHGAGVGVAY